MQPIENGSVTSPKGFRAGSVASGLKKNGKLDIALVLSDAECAAAGLFTQNQVVAAPVTLCQEALHKSQGRARGVVMNAGNANACTGQPGLDNAQMMRALAAEATGIDAADFLVMSTGVIGVQLPMDKVSAGIQAAARTLSTGGGPLAAQAIMTTDTRPKHLAVSVGLSRGPVIIGGMAKGAGMIHPDMATMLALITTDAHIPEPHYPAIFLEEAVDVSFNCISVDGDTSTNDTVLFLANGASGVTVTDADREAFEKALAHVCTELAQAIVRDGEGVTKFVEIRVGGPIWDEDARRIANTIATSPLVKTAFAGSDPNWGRILAAAGRAGVEFDQAKADLWVGHGEDRLQLLAGGAPTDYAEADAAAIFALPEFYVELTFGEGPLQSKVWTCDMTHDYISINADYRT